MDEKDDMVIETETADDDRNPGVNLIPFVSRTGSLSAVKSEVDKIVQVLAHLRQAAILQTNESDWVAMRAGDKTSYYLQEKGAARLAQFYGVVYPKPDVEAIDDHGYPAFLVSGEIHSRALQREIYYEGGRSGKDDFYSTEYVWNDAEKKKLPRKKSPEDVSVMDVRKAAMTNWIGGAIRRMAGLGDVTGEELTAAGKDLSKIAGFGFKAATKDGGFKQEATPETEDTRKKLDRKSVV